MQYEFLFYVASLNASSHNMYLSFILSRKTPGYSISLSSDGTIMAVGAPGGENGAGSNVGTVSMYQKIGSVWTLVGSPIFAPTPATKFGYSVSLSEDGMMVAVGTDATGGSQNVRVFSFDGTQWAQKGPDMESVESDYGSKF